jgi:hypothetical protein
MYFIMRYVSQSMYPCRDIFFKILTIFTPTLLVTLIASYVIIACVRFACDSPQHREMKENHNT